MAGALDGITVLDFSEMIAAPVAGMLLASMGADVIKLEPPTGEPWRLAGQFIPLESKVFIALNVGKRSLAIDLTAPGAREVIDRLVRRVDVVLVNYRADVPARFGLDYETVRAVNPNVVYCGNSAFGLQGPDAGKPGYDLVIQAMSGMLAGDRKVDPSGAPGTITATAIADFATGLAMAWAVCGALFARERLGRGQKLETTLLGTALLMQASRLVKVTQHEGEQVDAYLQALDQARAAGCSWQELLDLHAGLRPSGAVNVCYRSYETRTSVITIAALSAPLRRKALAVIGVDDPRVTAIDIRPGTPEYQQMNAELTPKVEAIMRSKSAEEWIAAFEAAGVPCGPVRFIEELVDDPQARAEGLITTIDHALAGEVEVIGPIIKMHETPTAVSRPSPALGQHNDEILAELGFSPAEIAALRYGGAIL
jgi:formyl-CoA transferase